jgi:opacity protein-like surface antigen
MTSLRWGLRVPSVGALHLFALFTVFAILTAVAQTPDQPQQQKAQRTFKPFTDISIGTFGQLTYTRTPTTSQMSTFGTTTTEQSQGTSPSPGVFGTFHQQLKPLLGYNVNFGYTKFSEDYSYGQQFVPSATSTFPASSSFTQGSIGTSMYDLTVAYVFEGPRNKRFNTFGQFGGGGLFFLPSQNTLTAKDQTRPAMVFGVGTNYKLTDHLDFRAEYRGLFYKSPDFTLPPYDGFNFPMAKLFTVTSTPAVSLVYRFGGAQKVSSPAKSQ